MALFGVTFSRVLTLRKTDMMWSLGTQTLNP